MHVCFLEQKAFDQVDTFSQQLLRQARLQRIKRDKITIIDQREVANKRTCIGRNWGNKKKVEVVQDGEVHVNGVTFLEKYHECKRRKGE